jgi:glucose-6-phosphate dehydrogenase assembly protein OpcA
MARLQDLESVSIRHRLGSGASGLLLACWLASRVGWEPRSALPGAGVPQATSRPSTNMIVSCPSARNKPTVSGRCSSLISLHVLLSMAAMWSASKACRNPSVYAVSPILRTNTPLEPRR